VVIGKGSVQLFTRLSTSNLCAFQVKIAKNDDAAAVMLPDVGRLAMHDPPNEEYPVVFKWYVLFTS